jgi:hypothetical protein
MRRLEGVRLGSCSDGLEDFRLAVVVLEILRGDSCGIVLASELIALVVRFDDGAVAIGSALVECVSHGGGDVQR